MVRLIICLTAVAYTSIVLAVEEGDVVIIKADAPLKVSGKEVGQVKAGEIRKVKEVRGAWIDVGQPKSGWVRTDNVLAKDLALDHLNELIADQKTAERLVARGRIQFMSSDLRAAESDFKEALDLDPQAAYALYYRGRLELRQNNFYEAETFFKDAIASKNDEPEFYRYLAIVMHEESKFPEMIANLQKMADLGDTDYFVYNTLGWWYATNPDSKLRDGKAAIKYATKGCELTHFKDYMIVDTLAAAHAEDGDFTNAIVRQEEALELCDNPVQEADVKKRLNQYRLNQPFREAPRYGPEMRQKLEKL